jgi:uncharacterized protein (DUF2237 family)
LFQNLTGSAIEHAKKVANYLSTMEPPERKKRPSRTDEQIENIIIARWDEASGSGTRMLRILRHKEKIACEQSRFAAIFRRIKMRMQ